MASPSRLPVTVILLGFASFFGDVASDMIFPLLPFFLTVTLGAKAGFLGLIEGTADTVSGLVKLWAGQLTDRLPRKKPLVLAGYALAALARPLMAFTGTPAQALAVRVTDRIGKGIRTAPRDALIATATHPDDVGRAFGVQRAMDHAGALVGPVIATALLARGLALPSLFLIAAVPGALSLVAVLLAPEPPAPSSGRAAPVETRVTFRGALSPRFRRYLAVLALFSLGNSSDAFLLLRAGELGVPTPLVPTLWAMLHVSRLTSSYWGGRLSDRWGRVRPITAGWWIFGVVYLGLAVASAAWQVWLLVALYGTYSGLTEPVERALVRDLVPDAARGRAFGAFHAVVGLAALPASLGAGLLWQTWGASTALGVSAALACAAAVLLPTWALGGGGSGNGQPDGAPGERGEDDRLPA